MGRACRYDGRHCLDEDLPAALAAGGLRAVPFCPEEHGGLGTPWPAARIAERGAAAVADGQAVMLTKDGADVTAEFLAGAKGAAQLCEELGIKRAFLKERSPSCGVASTHVAGELVPGRDRRGLDPSRYPLPGRRAGLTCRSGRRVGVRR